MSVKKTLTAIEKNGKNKEMDDFSVVTFDFVF